MKVGCKDIEVFDFERSFISGTENISDIVSTTGTYVNKPNARAELLNKMRKQGMDDTRKRFREKCKGSIVHLLTLKLEDFLKIFDPSL